MANMDDKVCLNHTDVVAVTRCTGCFKPLCQECILERKGNNFCTDLCAAKHFATNKGIEDFAKDEKKRSFRRKIKKAAMLFLLVALCFAGYRYWTNHKEKIKTDVDALRHKAEELQSTVAGN